jgi:hypothetical protein
LKLDEKKKSKHACQFGSAKWFWPRIFAQFAQVGKGIAKPNNTCAVDWKTVRLAQVGCYEQQSPTYLQSQF